MTRALYAGLMLAFAAHAAAPIRVMILDGRSAGSYHDWKQTTPALKKALEDARMFDVAVVTAPESDAALSDFLPDFAKYQAIVLNYDGADWPTRLKASFERYMNDGGGLVIVHAADNAFPDWPAFNKMIGVGGWRGRDERSGPHWYFENGKPVADRSREAAGSHGDRLPFLVTTRAPDHPVMRGLPPTFMHAPDELYAGLRGPGENMTVLATAYSDPANHGTGRDEPVLMAIDYGKGRVFHTTLGHDVVAMRSAGFIATFQRGVEWAATGRVTQVYSQVHK